MAGVSVVITTLDRLAFLREAIASVRAQDDAELIVVDDGSSDGTRDWLAAQDLRAVYVEPDASRSRQGNVAAARNAGAAAATGRHVWFLDDDDRLRPGAVAALAALLDEHGDAVAAVGARTRVGDVVVGGRVAHPLRRSCRDVGAELLLGWGFIPSQTLVRASALRAAGGWDERVEHSEDLELWLRLAALGPVVLEPETVVEYRVHPGQTRLTDRVRRRDALIRPHAARLAGGNARRGTRLRDAGRSWDAAKVAFDDADYPRAFSNTVRAALLAPALLRSPALAPLAARMLVRSALRCTGPTRRWVERRPERHHGERPRRGAGYLS